MRSKAEVTTRYAKAYVNARKKDKGKVLDEVVSVTGWSRDNARRRSPPRRRSRKYSMATKASRNARNAPKLVGRSWPMIAPRIRAGMRSGGVWRSKGRSR